MGCDANSHHTCWGSSNVNNRGDALLDYLVTTDLDILNVGAKPTFVTAVRQEVIDLSLATANIVSDISGWRVSDEESLSDHRYIKFSIKSDRIAQTKWRNPSATRWDAYYADLEKALGGPTGCVNTSEDIEKEVSQLQNGLITVPLLKITVKKKGIIQERVLYGGTQNWIKCVNNVIKI